MTTAHYELLEKLPYPRSSQPGPLIDQDGNSLHGAYQRRVSGGFRTAIVNNGRAIYRYRYRASLFTGQPGPRHSFGNLVHTLTPWMVPGDAQRPTTNYPTCDASTDSWRPLWHEPIILGSVIEKRKPAGLLWGDEPDTDLLAAGAIAAGLMVIPGPRWINGLGQLHVVMLIARPGPIASDGELRWLADEYRRQLPGFPLRSALRRLERLSACDLVVSQLTSPQTEDDLIVSGFTFGYPPATTAACIDDTHG